MRQVDIFGGMGLGIKEESKSCISSIKLWIILSLRITDHVGYSHKV
jgi:hypothetical protein